MSAKLDTLRKARELISEPMHWTKGQAIVTIFRREVPHYSTEAFAYCAIGALEVAYYHLNGKGKTGDFGEARAALRDQLPEGSEGSIAVFNDHKDTKHADILALFDRAIAQAEKEDVK